MTDEEIKKICTEYADEQAQWFPELKERNKYRDKMAQAKNVIRHIQRDYAIVPKSEIRDRYKESKLQSISYSRIDMFSGTSRMKLLESIFGKETFEEEKK